MARVLGRPLYDFAGVRAFKERLHPTGWDPVWLTFPEGESSVVHIHDSLKAFAQGSLPRFALRSILRHPSGPPWAISLLLACWTSILAVAMVADRSDAFGLSRVALASWTLFDALVAVLLFRLARHPSSGGLALATAIAVADAVAYLPYLLTAHPPETVSHVVLRIAAMAGPLAGALALGWATVLRADRRRGVGP